MRTLTLLALTYCFCEFVACTGGPPLLLAETPGGGAVSTVPAAPATQAASNPADPLEVEALRAQFRKLRRPLITGWEQRDLSTRIGVFKYYGYTVSKEGQAFITACTKEGSVVGENDTGKGRLRFYDVILPLLDDPATEADATILLVYYCDDFWDLGDIIHDSAYSSPDKPGHWDKVRTEDLFKAFVKKVHQTVEKHLKDSPATSSQSG